MRIKPFSRLFLMVARKLPKAYHATHINLALFLRAKRTRVTMRDGLYVARHGSDRIHFCRIARYTRYRNGIASFIEELAQDYHLHLIHEKDGTFIDCGANVGELGYWARQNGYQYNAFEPEALEADCCDHNNFGGTAKTNRLALWKEKATLKFYLKPEAADSSLFEIDDAVGVTEVEADRLDNLVDTAGLRRPIILKIEAEGAEPEVLAGAERMLGEVDYVAVDCGYERGREKAHTFVEVNEILVRHGYFPVAANFKRVTFLYRLRSGSASFQSNEVQAQDDVAINPPAEPPAVPYAQR